MSYLEDQRFEGPCRLCGTLIIRYWGKPQLHPECLDEMMNPRPRVSWWQWLRRWWAA